jgi:N-acetylneuraminate synthase/sialic acid synthase
MRQIKIEKTVIDDNSECFVIAEVGHNHQGNVETAKKIFDKAKEAGVNAVKLQKRDNKSLFTREMYDSHYDSENSYGATYGAHRDALEFGMGEYVELQQYAKELGLIFFATPFDLPSVDFLENLNVPLYKVASGDLKSAPLLKYVAQTGKPVLISTGGGEMHDVQRAHNIITDENPNIGILQCTGAYPCQPEDMNLNVITTYRSNFPDKVIGLSDHQSGISMSLVAFTLGARIIEKHFTLNRAWKGTDHAFSLEPVGLKKLVRDLKRARVSLGDGVKKSIEKEKNPLLKMGKKLVAAGNLKKGEILKESDIAMKSPGDGLPPYEWDNVIGLTLKKNMEKDENILLEYLE